MVGKRIFMTGAGGYIGSTIAEKAIPRGYEIYGLSRKESTDEKLKKIGVTPVRGDLLSAEILREQSAKADIVIHLADSLGDFFGQDYSNVVRTDGAAVDAMAAGILESDKGDSSNKKFNKPFLTTSGSLVVAATGSETDENSALWEVPINGRIKSEQHALELSDKGIRVSAIRLAPFVYGRGGSGVKLFMFMYAGMGEVKYIGFDDNKETVTSTVHVDDAAELYLLAIEKAKPGDVFNGVSSTVSLRALSEAMGKALDIPVKSISYEDAKALWGEFFARFLSTENWASGAKAVRELGWHPRGASILDEVNTGSYVAVAQELKQQKGK